MLRINWSLVRRFPLFVIVFSGIILAISTNLPFAFYEENYGSKAFRVVEQNQSYIAICAYIFFIILILGNAGFYCVRSQARGSRSRYQIGFNVLCIALETIVLALIFFFSRRVDGYWFIAFFPLIMSFVYMFLCTVAIRPR